MANVNYPPRQDKTASEILRDCNITIQLQGLGQYSTTCPKCSQDRKKKKAECLSVKIDHDGVVWHCNHCDWKGGEKYSNGGDSQPGKQTEVYYYYGNNSLRKVRREGQTPKYVWQHKKDGEWRAGAGGFKTGGLMYRADGVRDRKSVV